MVEKIGNCDLVICPLSIKNIVLKEITEKKIICNYKYMTLDQFKESVIGSCDEKGLYFLMKKYKLDYLFAKKCLDNIFVNNSIINKYRNTLEKENLLVKKEFPYRNIVLIGYDSIEPYLRKELDKYNVRYIDNEVFCNRNDVYEFDYQQDEIVYLAEKIIKDLDKIDINDMFLVISEDYEIEIRRIFNLFNIPIMLDNQSIYSLSITQKFLSKLIECKNIELSLKEIPKNDIYNKIVSILNRYYFIDCVDDVFIDILKNEFKKAKISKQYEGYLRVINIDDIYDSSKYYYILGFNQNVIPRVYEEDGLITDIIKKENNMFTSKEKNIIEKKKVINIISYPNIYISYKKNDRFNSYYPSYLAEDLGLDVKKEKSKLNVSNIYNKMYLSSLLDDYINYSVKDKDIYYLYPTYQDLDFKTYDNKYKEIDNKKLIDYLKNEINLSYSSMNNYFLCPFKFYVDNILKLNKMENTFPILIGNIFHHVLQNLYSKDFDIDSIFDSFTREYDLLAKEKFYVNKLKKVLLHDIEVIKMQDNNSSFKTKITEKKIVIEKNGLLKVHIVGVVDKISLLDNYVIITDYKTGNNKASLDNISDGLNMQLPMYIYLVKNGFNNVKVVGFYLQRLINKYNDSEDIINNLKLDGYTIDDLNIIENIDCTYEDSSVIKGMKRGKNGFYSYTKLISDEEIELINEITEKNIDLVIKAVEKAGFKINPKRMKNELISCKYCKYKDLCFYKEEDITNLKQKSFKEIVGDENA